MAFFGLTALGPQNTFEVSASHYRSMQIFDEKDFLYSWKKVNQDKLHCYKSKIPEIMRALFHGPVPKNEQKPVDEAFDEKFETDETVSLESFLRIMNRLREDADTENKSYDGKAKPNCDFNSSREFSEALQKNASSKSREIKVKQMVPLTGQQEYGWDQKQDDLHHPTKGREGSDITKFAAELIKNGIYY